MRPAELLRIAFETRGRVGRRRYITIGASLMAAKYVIDAAVIFAMTGVVWTPIDYLLPLASLSSPAAAAMPAGLSIALLIWTLPFIWIGVNMSVRRAIDAQLPPWLALAFFVPLLNYILMFVLAVAPTAQWSPETVSITRVQESDPDDDGSSGWLRASPFVPAVAGAASALVVVAFVLGSFRIYGLSLFLGAPFVLGLVTGYVANWSRPRPRSQTMALVCLAMVLAAAGMLMFALEGGVCLVMAFPITLPIALLGGIVGGNIVESRQTWKGGIAMLLAIVPAGSAIDRGFDRPVERVILTSVEIDAPPARVWHHVVAFDEITAPPEWYFRLGLAYPLRARIEGTGPGAIRYCEFTTGAFREPITDWVEPERLTFAVTDQPAPLQEWSPYSHVYAPHLVGYFRTTRGEFRLVKLGGGRTRLEGRTWYWLRMAPAAYWNPVADAILHRIHERVLRHVKSLAEVKPKLT